MNLVPAFRPPKSECLAHAPCSNDRNIHDDYLGYLCSTQGFVRSCVGSSVDRRNITAIQPQIRTVDIISQRAGQKRHCIGDIVGPPNTGYPDWHDFLTRAQLDLCPLVLAPALLARMSRSPSNCSACFVATHSPFVRRKVTERDEHVPTTLANFVSHSVRLLLRATMDNDDGAFLSEFPGNTRSNAT